MTVVRSTLFSRFSSLLFGMSTTDGGVSNGTFGMNLSFNVGDDPERVRENRRRFFGHLGISESAVAFTRQEHTTNVREVAAPGIYPESDGLMTATAGVFLAVSSADCTPVMLYDRRLQIVAGVHAGWRGTAGRITGQTVRQLHRSFGTAPEDIVAFIGPSAGVCCYEVGVDVAAQFPQECTVPHANGKFLLDVKKANVLQLLENGVQNSNIETHPDCSIHDSRYHSFRRDGKGSGRMFAVIGLLT